MCCLIRQVATGYPYGAKPTALETKPEGGADTAATTAPTRQEIHTPILDLLLPAFSETQEKV